MPLDSFVDLDELVLECRTVNAKGYVAEAVASYRAGAFRACIVMTWITVVYDIIDKLRELDLAGDNNAHQTITDFDNIVHTADLAAALAFERKLLNVAKDSFSLLSDVEHVALTRLQEDRNRCAHPSFFSPGDVYRPTPELARSHLRSAVEYLLRHPPVQGKAALDRLLIEIRSDYFPSTREEAVKVLRGGPLVRARPALVRNLLIVLLKDLLTGDFAKLQHIRRAAATRALIEMHSEVAESTLSGKINALILGLEDKHLLRGVATIYRVPEIQAFLEENARIKLSNFVTSADEVAVVAMFSAVLQIGFLRAQVIGRVSGLSRDAVANLGAQTPPLILPELTKRLVELYRSSASFAQANTMATSISNVAKQFDAGTAELALRSAANTQVRYSSGFDTVLHAVKTSGSLSPAQFNGIITELQLEEEYAHVLFPADAQTASQGPFETNPVADSLDSAVALTAETGGTSPL